MNEHFKAYTNGWIKGDAVAVLAACRDDFVYDDPIDGRMDKARFAAYLKKMFDGTSSPEVVADVVGRQEGEDESVWCWWVEDTWEGAALARVAADGVRSQKVTYYARQPDLTPGRTSI